MADENIELSKKSSDGKGLILLLITFVILLIVAVAVATFFLFSNMGTSKASVENETKVENITQSSGSEAKFKAEVNDLVLNLTDTRGREKILKLSFSIRSSEATIEEIVTNHLAEITDIVITQVSSRSSEELLTVGGKNILKDELISELNGIMNYARKTGGNIVNNIFFTAFVIK
ncbi:flagellar basal body-associated protein FliL [Aliarcobacter thereius]|uniref:Flagellar protein FliL n=2 Tax=Aliarcobacter thereius TaxID=544718 RepID=A0A1C0B9J3_9BACT|nr:flagellar basal body-associated FliL family protein [Aliarcobacter thereius]OCL88588.1 flagellar basal body-associated protein FliL [Aliarcobacter thereius]OCL92082.1 flagellar basal body-associated protein FliL [Aliarcobacter thereius]OCL94822.1 flagellar basal body-associated protein FliL [Aliarcobacter thereius LMG 24486]OCM00269.1 flagellar basal body-associated protein FliL [Aliarcobacter thereius]QBF15303.1 flagellar motor-associated protein FliL [Aliarcobacter thereius LMG 24486]